MKNVALLGFVVGFLGSIVACSAAPTETDTTDAKETTQKPTPQTPASKTPAATPTTTPTKAPATTAGAEKKQCIDDCAANDTDGAKAFGKILVPCACDASVCGDACGDSCGAATGPDLLASASDACRTCVAGSLQTGSTCNKTMQKECPKDASCVPFALCVQGCQ